jgi:LPS O-antigen subunit length determinant protein (WzzB/FepE family)
MEQSNRANVDEINLYDLWLVILKRKKLIIGLCLIVVILAAIISLLMPKTYGGDAVLSIPQFEIVSLNISSRDLLDLIGKIDKERRARLLPKTSIFITDIKFNVFKDSKDKVEVVIESKDKNAISMAISEVIDYTNSIDLVKSTVKEEQEKLLKRAAELSTVLDASKDLLYTYRQLFKAGKLVPVGFNPIELNKRISDISLEKQMTEQSLQRLSGGVKLARQVDIKDKPVKPRIIMIIVLSGTISIFLAILAAFFLEFIEKIRTKERV